MNKKILATVLVATVLFTGCGEDSSTTSTSTSTSASTSTSTADETPAATTETFDVEYEMVGTTSSGLPKNDTFIFNGTTTDGIITELEFDIIRNKGYEDEYSKTDIMGYFMNVSDIEIVANDAGGFDLVTFTSNGYDYDFGENGGAQFMITAAVENLTNETTFADLTVTNTYGGSEVSMKDTLVGFKGLAKEVGIEELTEETLVIDLVAAHDLVDGDSVKEGSGRVSFEGMSGGRSYGEQIRAIAAHILASNMTLEDVYVMFKTENNQSVPIAERDAVAGATITFVGDFQRMAYIAIHGELFEGVFNTSTSASTGLTTVEVATQGYAGEIETDVIFDADGVITAVKVADANESDGIGAVLTADDSEFLSALVAGQDDIAAVDVVAGATVTSNALKNAVIYAQESIG